MWGAETYRRNKHTIQKRTWEISNEIFLSLITALLLLWLYLLNVIIDTYKSYPADNRLVTYSIFHFSVFVVILFIIVLFASKTSLEASYRKPANSVYKSFSRILKRNWIYIFAYISVCLALNRLDFASQRHADIVLAGQIIIPGILLTILVLKVSRKPLLTKVVYVILVVCILCGGYYVYIVTCSIVFSDLEVNAFFDEENRELAINIVENGYFFRTSILAVSINDEISIDESNRLMENTLILSIPDTYIMNRWTDYVRVEYRRGSLGWTSERVAIVRQITKLAI